MVLAVSILIAFQALVAFLLFQLVRQQGRMLLRLDAIEGHFPQPKPAPRGIRAGREVPGFELPALGGGTVKLSDFRGFSVLLVYWGADCGYCDMLAPDLIARKSDLDAAGVKVVLAAYGSVESNTRLIDEHGIGWPVAEIEKAALDSPERRALDAVIFDGCGTPSACLIDTDGTAIGSVQSGIEGVLELADDAIGLDAPAESRGLKKKPLSSSRIERRGLARGAKAPGFALEDIRKSSGTAVSLDQFRGRRLLLVFTDPNCGPCDRLAPQLVDFYGKHGSDGWGIVMVGRGDPEANRRKAAENDYPFPYVLQDRWKLSKEYGIFSTPVAFLIGPYGILEEDVAIGTDAIMALARNGLATKEKRWARTSIASPAS